MNRSIKLTDVLNKNHQDTEGETITDSEVVDALEYRGYEPLLLA